MIKSKKDKNPITAKSSQLNQERYQHLQQSRNSPLYHYNMYIRKEGQPVLSEEEYKEFAKRSMDRRNRKALITLKENESTNDFEIINTEILKYPLTPDESFKIE